MRLPVCIFDIESNMLCPSCQERLDNGEINEFDIEFSKWLLGRARQYPSLADLHLMRAIRVTRYLVLLVRRGQTSLLEDATGLLDEMSEAFGEVMIVEGPVKLRAFVRHLIAPAVEMGINSLYLPDGTKESIVMLRDIDRDRIRFTKEELRQIVSGVTGQPVLFEYESDRVKKEEEEVPDEFEERLRQFGPRRRRRM